MRPMSNTTIWIIIQSNQLISMWNVWRSHIAPSNNIPFIVHGMDMPNAHLFGLCVCAVSGVRVSGIWQSQIHMREYGILK